MSCTDGVSLIAGADRMGCILDDINLSFTGRPPNRIHVTRQTTEMDGYDCPRPIRYTLPDRAVIDVPVCADVGEYRRGADVKNRGHSRAERQRSCDQIGRAHV